MSGKNIENCHAVHKIEHTDDNSKKIADEEYKIIQEESMDSKSSEGSTLNLENVSKSEKNNLTKRKHGVPPLLVTNLPENYSLQEIHDNLEKLCGPFEIRSSKIANGCQTIEAIFSNTMDRSVNKIMLNSHTINNITIRAESPGILPDYESESLCTESDHEGPQAKRKKETGYTAWGLDMDVWQMDPKGWYGVKPKYLASLGINDGLQNWVLVLNFRCGREELKEVMEIAGEVVVCTIHRAAVKRYANVMYKHPLEALQAVSMLNGQMLYGRPLTVKFTKIKGMVLPKGLTDVGPGLARYGRPLRDVVRHYERFIKGQDNDLNSNIFRTPHQQSSNDEDNYSENEDNVRKARDALETLVYLVDQGVKVKDLLLQLRSIKANKNNSIDQLLNELSDVSDAESNYDDISPPGTSTSKVKIRPKGEIVRSGSVNSKASVKSVNPELNKSVTEITRNPSTTQSAEKICTISSNRSSESRRSILTNQTPAPYESMFGPRQMGPGPMRPISGPSSVGRGTMIGPGQSMPGPMQGQAMPGPMQGQTMPGPVQGQSMPGPMQGQSMPGPMQGQAMPGPMPGQPMPGPMPVPMAGPMMSAMPRQGPMPGPMPVPRPGPSSISAPTSGPNPGLNGSMSGQVRSGPAGPLSGPNYRPGPNFSMPGPSSHPPFGPSLHPSPGPEATLQFSNLPPSTTFAMLSDKLSQVGQLVSIQFTTPGCVVVKFAHRTHAERCLQQFDQSRLQGNLISVKFV